MITFSWSLSEFMMNVVKSTTLSTNQEKPEKVAIEAPFVDQHWSFQHTIAKMPSVPNEKEIDSCLADAADAWKPLEGSKAETPCGIDWKHGIQNHLSHQCLRLRLLPSATALGSC